MIKVPVYYCRKKRFDNATIHRLMPLNAKYKFIKTTYIEIFIILI